MTRVDAVVVVVLWGAACTATVDLDGLTDGDDDAGAGGAGGTAMPLTVAGICDLLCELEQQLGCDPAICGSSNTCDSILLNDAYPWCEQDLLALGECYAGVGANGFTCVDDQSGGNLIKLLPNTCPAEISAWQSCINEGANPNIAMDCDIACNNGFAGASLCADPGACVSQCPALTTPAADCSGAWSGLMHCAATHLDAQWSCDDLLGLGFPTPDIANPCIRAYVQVYECVSST